MAEKTESEQKKQKQPWDDYFLSVARVVSGRSPDPNTKHGCVLVDKENRILATGYNGPVAGLPDDMVDYTRPNKYTWMCHAEQNALCFARCDLSGATAYVTGRPCPACFRMLVQSGIQKIVHGPVESACISAYDREACAAMASAKGVQVQMLDM